MTKEEQIQKLILASIHSAILVELLDEIETKQMFKKQTKRYITALESHFLKLYDTIYQRDQEMLLNLTKKHETLAKWIAKNDTGKILNLLSEIDALEYDGEKKLFMEKVK